MIESDIPAIMSGIIRNSGQNHHPSQEYRLLASDPSQLSEDELPGDLQSLSWLTSVDVPRLQQMASGRMDFSLGAQNAMLQQPGPVTNTLHSTGAPGAMIHVQASLPQGILGLNSISTHGPNQMSPYAVGGQLSPGLQTQQQLFPPPPPPPPPSHSQQVFALAQNTQQCNPAGIYNTSYGTQPHYSQPRLAPHSAQELHPKHYPKPIYSYSCLIAMALKNSKTGSLPVSEIYSFMKEHFPYFKTAPDGWKNSVRHNLSLNKCFEKVENKLSGTSRKGCLWALNPAKIDKMEEEMQKWKRKDLAAIHRSMANPEELDKLITDRPESCRRPSKQAEPEVPPLSHMATAQGRIPVSQLQPQPIMTLSLQSLPLHHQLQTQARIAPNSPAPAQTPPLHTLPDMSHSPLPHHPLGRAPPEFPNVPADMSTEVDALDPSIMDFALQGNIWEEMKDESFSLDTLGAFSTSPLHLSDCDLGTPGLTPVSSSSDRSFPDLQVTGLYTTYTTLDNVAAAQYMTPQGNKPIPLL
ncbi:forkhead box protein N4 isoform X1 [Chiroxiphia lanceolata]|uniref:forkhead box protein N4 isoform X1 n=2 Tax=Chiroxiphia lanceolata TaxID=296741 RepID=UPI0013CE584C|nr:forkhead box protein N4 isoform X1 [Chiroxiphia lanceolata]XP_032561988.1 forkhead box protein N4 isoform X1 [Chiroxiphia lanceolata]XP_032561989.1 forkhead box protein N4 isoform X1 [Chiroxiphia lanceolata]